MIHLQKKKIELNNTLNKQLVWSNIIIVFLFFNLSQQILINK